MSLSDRLPRLERFFNSIRHRHTRVFSLASSEPSSFEKVPLHKEQSTTTLFTDQDCVSGLPLQPSSICKRRWKLFHTNTFVRAWALPFKAVDPRFVPFRPPDSIPAPGGKLCLSFNRRYQLEMFHTVPRRLLPRSFGLVSTRRRGLFNLSCIPFGLKGRRFFSVSSPAPDFRRSGKRRFRCLPLLPISTPS